MIAHCIENLSTALEIWDLDGWLIERVQFLQRRLHPGFEIVHFFMIGETVPLTVLHLRSSPQIDIQIIRNIPIPFLPTHLQQTENLIGISSGIPEMRKSKPILLIDLVFHHHLHGDLLEEFLAECAEM